MGLGIFSFKKELDTELPIQMVEELFSIKNNGFFLSTRVRPKVYWLNQKMPLYYRGTMGFDTTLRCKIEPLENGTKLSITSSWSFVLYLIIFAMFVVLWISLSNPDALIGVVLLMIFFFWAAFLGYWNDRYLYLQIVKFMKHQMEIQKDVPFVNH